MKYLSALLTQASGSVGGATASSNRGGNYFRARVAPVQPRTVAQQGIRAQLAAISSSWRGLTASQIAGWNSLATSVTLHDSLGNTYKPSGSQLYLSCNANLNTIAAALITDPPANAPTLPEAGPLTLVVNVLAGGNFTVDSPFTEGSSAFYAAIRTTGKYSPGISYVGKSVYRDIYSAVPAGAPMDIKAAFEARFGALVAGSQVAVALKVIDPATGFAGIEATATAIIA